MDSAEDWGPVIQELSRRRFEDRTVGTLAQQVIDEVEEGNLDEAWGFYSQFLNMIHTKTEDVEEDENLNLYLEDEGTAMNDLLEAQLRKIIDGYFSGLVSGGELDTALQFGASFSEEGNEKNRQAILDALELIPVRGKLRIQQGHLTHDPFKEAGRDLIRKCFI